MAKTKAKKDINPNDRTRWTKQKLGDECKARSLKVSGNKTELLKRLIDDDQKNGPEEQEADADGGERSTGEDLGAESPKGAPRNGFQAAGAEKPGGEKLEETRRENEPEKKLKCTASEIERGKVFREQVLAILIRILEGNGTDEEVFHPVVDCLGKAVRELGAIVSAEAVDNVVEQKEGVVEQKEDEVENGDYEVVVEQEQEEGIDGLRKRGREEAGEDGAYDYEEAARAKRGRLPSEDDLYGCSPYVVNVRSVSDQPFDQPDLCIDPATLAL
ncbi:hypothetical protein LTR62_008083 [Meristemomyces frigidus]|uniref:SAP domain-containing protein n=1 Tax=Meristemomyces frigidus TaxID=1508187 RepID=A0AAN7YM27_9PEZI|nr:hypothetical protein LTR62_008083 [Meristemomyces frigidus]